MADVSERAFPSYLEMPSTTPIQFWWFLRALTFVVMLWVMYLIVTQPLKGMLLFWKVLIPSLPLLFAVAPGVWRHICPMALLNQTPRMFGLSLERRLPQGVKNIVYFISVLAFFFLVSLRHLFFNVDSYSLIILMGASLAMALVGGFVFAGRSGWCGTLCPLAPIQKAYGHAPLVVVRNGYCPSCVGCQKNCYDFNPKAAFISDLADKDPWYAGHKRFFVAGLPGFAIAFFTAPPPQTVGLFVYYLHICGWIVTTLGLFSLVRTFIRMSDFRAAALASMSALVIFYWFTAKGLIETLLAQIGFPTPEGADKVFIAGVVVVAALVLRKGYIAEKAFDAMQASAAAPRTGVRLDRLGAVGGGSDETITERASGRSFPVRPGQSLLEGMESAGLAPDYGCRLGVCGADPIVVVEGQQHLSAPTDDEIATLRRLGLEGRARMACVCKAGGGPVVIDAKTDPHSLPAPEPARDSVDVGLAAGVHKVVVIGNGASGISTADEIRRLSPSCQIDVIARENHPFYNRMAIGRLLYESAGLNELYLMKPEVMAAKKISVRLNTHAVAIDREAKQVVVGTGDRLAYDRLVLATGASAFSPPIGGADLPGSFVLREASDAQALRAYRQVSRAQRAVVLGGGVLGVEAADALRRLNLRTTIVQRSDRLMDRELDEKGSRILATFLDRLGVDIVSGASVARLEGDGRVQRAVLTNDATLATDIFVACAGTRPNTEIAADSGLTVNRGVVVDAQMRTSDPDIFAVGDVAERLGEVGGLWAIATAQAEVAAAALLNAQSEYRLPIPMVSLKMEGIDVKGFGAKLRGPDIEEIVDPDEPDGIHRKLLAQGGQIVGAVFVGPPGTGKELARLVQSKANVGSILDRLRRYDWDALKDA